MSSGEIERQKRDRAQASRGEVVEGSGKPLEPKTLEHVVSLRLEGWLLRELRQLAKKRGTSVSALIREAAEDVVTAGTPTTRIEWRVTSVVGTGPVQLTKWLESPTSRAALKDLRESVTS